MAPMDSADKERAMNESGPQAIAPRPERPPPAVGYVAWYAVEQWIGHLRHAQIVLVMLIVLACVIGWFALHTSVATLVLTELLPNTRESRIRITGLRRSRKNG